MNISTKAKEIREPGEPWKSALARAAQLLYPEGSPKAKNNDASPARPSMYQIAVRNRLRRE